MTADMTGDEETSNGVSSRPGVVIVGPNNVGKRSILSRTTPFLEQVKWRFGYSINEGFCSCCLQWCFNYSLNVTGFFNFFFPNCRLCFQILQDKRRLVAC